MSGDLVLWGKRPDGTWLPIERGGAATIRRERSARTPSSFWQELRTLAFGVHPEATTTGEIVAVEVEWETVS